MPSARAACIVSGSGSAAPNKVQGRAAHMHSLCTLSASLTTSVSVRLRGTSAPSSACAGGWALVRQKAAVRASYGCSSSSYSSWRSGITAALPARRTQ